MTTATWTPEAAERLTRYLDSNDLSAGMGTEEEEICSIVAINLALTNTLTDDIPECMSQVIGEWIIAIQDAMPDTLRNSAEWKRLLPESAGTGRELERERLAIIMEWLWETVLPHYQESADQHNLGDQWRQMCENRNDTSASLVQEALFLKSTTIGVGTVERNLMYVAGHAEVAARHVAGLVNHSHAGEAAMYAAFATVYATREGWESFSPTGLLERLVH